MTVLRLPRACTLRYWTAGPPDAQGNPADVWTEVEAMCQFAQSGRQEIGDGQVSDTSYQVTLGRDALLPKAADQIVVDGVTYEFRGDAWAAHSINGRLDHIEATAARAA